MTHMRCSGVLVSVCCVLGVGACSSSSPPVVAASTTVPAVATIPSTTPAISAATTAAATTPATLTPAPTVPRPYPNGIRNVRYCEVLLLAQTDGVFTAEVWNTMGHGECPQADWDALDGGAIAKERGTILALLNGPRYWTLDEIDATVQLTAPVTTFGTIEMFRAATVDLGPTLPQQTPYTERSVARDTVFRFKAGTPVYELTAPDGRRYVMQSYSQQIDPTMTADRLASLGEVLTPPAGWTFTTRPLDADLEVFDSAGVATVIQDEFQNSYQRIDVT